MVDGLGSERQDRRWKLMRLLGRRKLFGQQGAFCAIIDRKNKANEVIEPARLQSLCGLNVSNGEDIGRRLGVEGRDGIFSSRAFNGRSNVSRSQGISTFRATAVDSTRGFQNRVPVSIEDAQGRNLSSLKPVTDTLKGRLLDHETDFESSIIPPKADILAFCVVGAGEVWEIECHV
jgi:hypothetical protein